MTLHRDFNQIARAYLADGPSELADRVLDDALWQVHVTRQRRRLVRIPWRLSTMNNDARVAIVTVAVVIVGSIGLAVVSPAPSDTGAETPSESLTPSPTDSPRPLPSAGDTWGPIGAGRYALAAGFPVPITFDVPPAWDACSAGPHEQGICARNNDGVSFLIVESIAAQCGDLRPVGPTVDDLVVAIRGLEGFQSTEPVEVLVDGYSGKQFELIAPAEGPPCGLETWATADRTNGVGGGEVNILQVIDVGGVRVLIAGAYFPPDFSDERATIQGIMASVRIGG